MLSKEQPSSWQGGTNSPSPKVFFIMCLPDLSAAHRDFFPSVGGAAGFAAAEERGL